MGHSDASPDRHGRLVVRYAYAMAAHAPLKTADLASVAVKSLPWAFLVSSIRFALLSLINNKELVTKIYFPKEIFPMAAVMASLFDLLRGVRSPGDLSGDDPARLEHLSPLDSAATPDDGAPG